MTLAELRSYVQDAVGDASTSQVDLSINQKYREMVVRSKWRMAEVSLGSTVAGTAVYVFSAEAAVDFQDVEMVRIDAASSANDYPEYTRVGNRQLWDLKGGRLGLRGTGGVFAPSFSSAGSVGIELYPAPTVSGDSIMALVASVPVTLVNVGDIPIIPTDLHTHLGEGAIGDLLKRIDEKIAEGDNYLSRYEAGVELLTQRRTGRIGGGPVQVQVGGKHF